MGLSTGAGQAAGDGLIPFPTPQTGAFELGSFETNEVTALQAERITVPRVHFLGLGSFETIGATKFVHCERKRSLESDYSRAFGSHCALASIVQKASDWLCIIPGMVVKGGSRTSDAGLDRAGRSELHYAVCDRDFTRVKEFIRQGANVNLADKKGWTPLHFAAQNDDEQMARLLLDSGASVDLRDENGNTPLSTGVFNSKGRGELIELLRQRGADATLANNYGVSPVSLARTIANYDLAQYFRDLK